LKITELRDCQVGLEEMLTPSGKFWRLSFQDGQDVYFADLPDQIMRAMAVKITTGKTIDIATRLPKNGPDKSVFHK